MRPGAEHLAAASPAQLEFEAVPHRWAALAVLLVGGFLPALDFFIVNVALPSIRQGLGAGDDVIQLVMSGFAAAYAVLLVMGGRLGDLYGRNRMFMIGMTGFALCSAWCGLAWSPYALVMGRLLQGATAAIMAPQVAASIHVLFAHEEKARAFSLLRSQHRTLRHCRAVTGRCADMGQHLEPGLAHDFSDQRSHRSHYPGGRDTVTP